MYPAHLSGGIKVGTLNAADWVAKNGSFQIAFSYAFKVWFRGWVGRIADLLCN